MNDHLWLGSETSFLELQVKMARYEMMRESLEDWGANPVGVESTGGVAIVSVRGPTLKDTTPLTRYFGIATYQDIKESIIKATGDPEVNDTILYISSPGGEASGTSALSKFIAQLSLNRSIMSYSDSLQASAACWYGSACRASIGDEEAYFGSIGVVMVHATLHRMYKEMGVDFEVFRSVPFKALGQSVEPLTDAAKNEFNQRLSEMHERFTSAIAINRKLDPEKVAEFSNGKLYTAKNAKKLGVIDDIMSLDSLVSLLLKKNGKKS